jgi:hypothetical protein
LRPFTSLIRTRIIVAIVPLVCTTSVVQAGQNPSSGVEQPAGSAFVLAPAVTVSDLGLDTNILATSDDPKSDMTGNFRMQIAPAGQVGPAAIRGTGGIALAYFQRYASQRSADADGSLRVDLRLNRFAFYAAGSALRIRDSFGPEIDLRVRRFETSVEGGGEVRATGKTSFAAGVSRSVVAFNASEVLFDSSLRQVLDRTVDTMSLVARNAVTPLTSLVAVVDLQHDRFPFFPLRDANATRLLAGFEFKPSALIAGKAHVGYQHFVSRDTRQPNVAGVVASVDLRYTFSDSLRFGVRVQRDLAHSYSLEERYFVSTDMRFSVTRRVNRAWDVTAMATRRQLDYRGALARAGVAAPVDHRFGYGGAVEHRLTKGTTIGVKGEYYRRESELRGRTYDRLRLVGSLAHRF